jgi:hypothetical protein
MSRPISASYLERKMRSISGAQGSDLFTDVKDLDGLIVLENDRPEWAKAGGEEIMGAGFTTAAAAANTSAAQMNNPAGSNVLCVVERVIVGFSAANVARLKMGVGTANLAGGNGLKSARDLRLRDAGSQAVSAALFFQQNSTVGDPSGGQDFATFRLLAETSYTYEAAIILPPNTSLYVVGVTVNVALSTSFVWRERPIDGLFDLK